MWPVGLSPRALTTLPRADNDLLMSFPSSNVSPSARVLSCRSDPAGICVRHGTPLASLSAHFRAKTPAGITTLKQPSAKVSHSARVSSCGSYPAEVPSLTYSFNVQSIDKDCW